MERLAAKRAAAAATTSSEDGGVGSVLSDNSGAAPSAAHTAHTAVSLAGEMQVGAADEELVSPSKRARKCRGSGPTADEEVEGQTFHSVATSKSEVEMEEEFYPEEADDMEDEGAAYVDDNDVGVVVSSSAAASVVPAAATPKATAVSAKVPFSSPSAAAAKSPLSSGFCPPAFHSTVPACLATTTVFKCPHVALWQCGRSTRVLTFVNAHAPTLLLSTPPRPLFSVASGSHARRIAER